MLGTLLGCTEPSNGCTVVPAPFLAEKRQPIGSFEGRALMLTDVQGKFGQASTPKITSPSSNKPKATAYWSPLRNL